MNLERQNQLLGILRNRYAMFGKNEQPMGVQGYNDFYWDEITELASLHPEYVRYTPPNPKGNPMYETGKHDVLPAIMTLPQNIGKPAKTPTETPASEAPAAPQVETRFIVGKRSNEYCWYVWDNEDNEEASGNYWSVDEAQARANELNANGPSRVVVDEKDERIAELEAQLQKAERVAAAFDSELGKEQQKRIKLETDLAAAQAIIVQAGKDFAALKDENARMREDLATIAHKAKRIYNGDVDMGSAKALALGIYSLSRQDSTPTPPAQEALVTPLPKFTVGQAVWVVFSYGREFGLSNKAAIVIEIKQEDGANWYRVKYELSNEDGSQWWEEYEICRRDYVPVTPKRPVATRCRVNWNQRGFSSGSYEVLGYSQDKQVYVLNISTDSDKPMPKAVKMADCVVVL